MRPFRRNFGALVADTPLASEVLIEFEGTEDNWGQAVAVSLGRADVTDLRDWLNEWLGDQTQAEPPCGVEPLNQDGRSGPG